MSSIYKSFSVSLLVVSSLSVVSMNAFSKTVRDAIKSIEKEERTLPSYGNSKAAKPRDRVNIRVGKPISSLNAIFPDGTAEAEYEKKLNQEINQLHKLSNKLNGGETKKRILLKLAKSYSEKSALADRRAQDEFEKKLKLYLAGSIKQKPRVQNSETKKFSLKSIDIYKQYLKNYKNTRGADEVLFFLGYNYMSLGNINEGIGYYKKLSDSYPRSEYINEANLSLADYYFDGDKRNLAKTYYEKVISNGRKSSSYVLATYKLAWLNRKMGDHSSALRNILQVVKLGSDDVRNRKSKILADEAKKDLPLFYSESGKPKAALTYFTNIMSTDDAYKSLEKLAFIYVDTGQKKQAKYLFDRLTEMKPDNSKSFDYQYAMVNMQASTGRQDLYEKELYKWVEQFSPDKKWAQKSKNNPKMAEAMAKAETSLRSHVLKLHQNFRKDKRKALGFGAKNGYDLYLKTFTKSEFYSELQFYQAELLYEMQDYPGAYKAYRNVKDPKYESKSKLNAVLSLEKIIPSDEEVRRKVGKSTKEYPLSKDEKDFVASAKAYVSNPKFTEKKLDIKYKLASIYYSHNFFSESEPLFKEIIKESPNSDFAKFSSNLIIDSYKLKNDYAGLEKAGNELVALGASTGNSSIEVSEVKNIVEKSAFKKIEEIDAEKKPEDVALAFLSFVKSYPNSKLKNQAHYNAGINFEKAKDPNKALSAYSKIDPSGGEFYENGQKFSAIILENTGRLKEAARSFEKLGVKAKDRGIKAKYLSNAAVINEAFNDISGMKRVFRLLKPVDSLKFTSLYDYRIAEAYKRRGDTTEELNTLLKVFNASKVQPFLLVKIATRIGDIYKDKRAVDKASYWYRASTLAYDKFKRKGAVKASTYAAKAKFELSNKVFYQYISIKIPKNPKQQASAITKKLAMIEQINKKMKEVINFDDGYTIVSALNRLGQSYQHLSVAILNAPLPAGLTVDEKKQFKGLLLKKVEPFQKNAITSYKKAYEKAEQLGAFNEDSVKALSELAKLDSSYERYKISYSAGFYPMPYDKKLLKKLSISEQMLDMSESDILNKTSSRLSKNKSDIKALVTLALFYSLKKLSGVSKIYLDKVDSKFKSRADYFNLQAYNSYLDQDYRLFVANLRSALKISSSHVPSALNLGSYYMKYGGYDKGGNYVSKVYPSSDSKIPSAYMPDAINNYALYLVSKGQYNRAISSLKSIKQLDSRYISSVANLAVLFKFIKKAKNSDNPYFSQYKALANSRADFDRIELMEKYK